MINTYRELTIYLDSLNDKEISEKDINKLDSSNMDLSGNIQYRVDNQFNIFIRNKIVRDTLDFQNRLNDITDKNTIILELDKLNKDYNMLYKLANVKIVSSNAKNEYSKYIIDCLNQYKESIRKRFNNIVDNLCIKEN